MAKWRGMDRGDVAFYAVMVAIIVVLVALKGTGVLPEPEAPPSYEERCVQACEGFDLEYHYSTPYLTVNRCWCLDSEGLPREVPTDA